MMWRGSVSATGEQREGRSRPVRQLVHEEMLNARIRARRAQDERWERMTERREVPEKMPTEKACENGRSSGS